MERDGGEEGIKREERGKEEREVARKKRGRGQERGEGGGEKEEREVTREKRGR